MRRNHNDGIILLILFIRKFWESKLEILLRCLLKLSAKIEEIGIRYVTNCN